jgi:putative CocE/NonD family hydrolase
MKITFAKIAIPVIAVILLLIVLVAISRKNAAKPKISEFGKYQGYSAALYNGTLRTSEYLTLSDGTRLAYDLIIPTQKGLPAAQPLPVLFKYTPYGRTWTVYDKNGKFTLGDIPNLDPSLPLMARVRRLFMGVRGNTMDPLARDKWLGAVVSHGYIVVSVDRPGTGASFNGKTTGSLETAAKYENEIINWIAAQPWSDGNIAMYGDSMQAMVQLLAASTGNPHLKAILPAASPMDMYQAVLYPGGVFDKAFVNMYEETTPMLSRLATPVDSDPDGVLLAQALAERNQISVMDMALQCPFIDATTDGQSPWGLMDPYPVIDRINRSQTAVYLTVGWYDIFSADMFYWYNNLSVPKRLTVRPTDHSQVSSNASDLNYSSEALRWLDYWLKGIDNGIMDEPPIHYYVQSGPKGGSWQISDQWPLANQKLNPYYFGPGRSGSSASVNDGSLVTLAPTAASTTDTYTVDYTATTGAKSRWGAVDAGHAYPNLSSHDARALTYTTPPLDKAVLVTGHPVAHLWLSTAAPDLDAFVYLEVVDSRGRSTYITEGDLRASHRKLGLAPFNVFDLPYQSHLQSDQQAIPSAAPFEMTFSLLPTSYQFNAGSRIRITLAFADAGNFDTPILNPAPVLQLLRDAGHPSFVELPIQQQP